MPAKSSQHCRCSSAPQAPQRVPPSERSPVVLPGRCRPPLGARTPKKLSRRHDFLDQELIREVAQEALGSKVRRVVPIKEGYGGAVYLLELEGERPARAILKAQLFEDTRGLDQEACFFETMRQSGLAGAVPVPTLGVLDLSGERLPCPFYLANRLPGRSLESLLATGAGIDFEAAASKIGGALATVHRIQTRQSTWGSLTAESRSRILSGSRGCTAELVGERHFSPQAWNEAILRRGHRVRSLGAVPTEVLDQWLRLVETFKPGGDLCLLHGDPSLSNFLFTRGRLRGVVDASTTLGVRQDEIASALVYLWLAQAHIPRDRVVRAWRAFVRGYAESSEPRGSIELPAEFLVKRIISRVDTYARIGRLELKLPLLVSLWDRLQAGGQGLTGVLAAGSKARRAASL